MFKSSLWMLLYWFLFSAAGTAAAGFIFMIAMDLTVMVAGQSLEFFCSDFFVRGIFASFPLVQILVFCAMIVYLIRHKKFPAARIFTYFFLGICVWLFLVPLSFKIEKKLGLDSPALKNDKGLSSGFFRKEGGGIFYFSEIHSDNTADGLFIDVSGDSGEAGRVFTFSSAIIDEEFSGNFADSLIKQAAKLPAIIEFPLKVYSFFLAKGHICLEKGFGSWVMFCSLPLLMLACIIFNGISVWPLVNALTVFFVQIVISVFNFAVAEGIVFSAVSFSWREKCIEIAGEKSTFFADMLLCEEPFLFFLNFAFMLIFIVAGIILAAVHSKKAENL